MLPGVPTVASSGLPGFESAAIQGIFAPAKTPAAIVNRISQATNESVHRAETKEKLFNAGVEPAGSTPQEFSAQIKSEITRLGKVIKDAHIRAE